MQQFKKYFLALLEIKQNTMQKQIEIEHMIVDFDIDVVYVDDAITGEYGGVECKQELTEQVVRDVEWNAVDFTDEENAKIRQWVNDRGYDIVNEK